MAGIDGMNASFEFLPIATGMEGVADIIMPKDGELGDGITDPIVGGFESFQADEIL